MTLRLGGDGAITGCTSLENPDLTVSGLTISGSFDAEKVLVASGTATAPSYTFSGDTDNGLYQAGTNSIGLATAGTNAILIDSSNRVGIGTTSPAGKLTLKTTNSNGAPVAWDNSYFVISEGDTGTSFGLGLSLDTTNNEAQISSLTPNTQWDPINYRASQHKFFVTDASSNEAMRIDSSGRVGVGTSSPRGLLHVGPDLASGATDAARINLKQNGLAATDGIYLERSGERRGYHMFIGAPNDGLTFRANNFGTFTTTMYLDRVGNVGIGTTSPNVALTIDKGATNSLIGFRQTSGETGYIGTSGATNGVITGASTNDLNIRSQNTNINFSVNGGVSMAAQIDSSGNVKIVSEHLRFNTSGKGIIFGTEGGSNRPSIIGNYTSSTDNNIVFNVTGNERMRIDSSGQLIIGATSSNHKLRVAGTNTVSAIIGSTNAGGAQLVIDGDADGDGSGGDYASLLHSSSGNFEINNRKNASILFKTGSSEDERMRILSTGGLTFNGDTAQANALDDYEEGTWTPTIRENGSGTAWDTVSANTGFYTKIGDCVTFSATFNYSGVATNVNSSFYGWLAGFPFASSSSKKAGQFFISFLYSGVRTVLYSVTFIAGNAYAGIYKDQDASSPGTMMTSEYPTGAHTVQFQGHYYI